MKTRHPLFKLLAVFLSVLFAFQALPVLASALGPDSDLPNHTVLDSSEEEKSTSVQAPAAAEETAAPAESAQDDENTEIIGEEEDLRERCVKHFRLADGRYMAAVYPEPVHYKKNGKWEDIDNTASLKKSKNGKSSYVVSKTATPVSFPEEIDQGDISMECRGHDLKLKVRSARNAHAKVSSKKGKGGKKTAAVDNKDSCVKYNSAFKDADLSYDVSSSQVKESIILRKKQKEYVYQFTFDAEGLEVLENGDGSISMIENGDEEHPIYVLSAPYMFDAKGERSDAVTMKAKQNADGLYTLTITADTSWINARGRSFPVVIDPTVLLDVGYLNIMDTYVDTASPYHHAYSSSLYVGKNSLGTTRTFIKYALPDLPDCSVVVGSRLYLAQQDYDPGSGTTSYIAAYSPSSSWTNTSLLWSNQPGYDTSLGVVDFTKFTAGTGKYNYELDITKIAKVWYETGVNNGIMLKAYNEGITRRSAFYSTNFSSAEMYPQISLTYVSSTGLEPYWKYETIDLGKSGTVYVNDYNGAMTYEHSDIDLDGNTMPLEFSHIYLSDNPSVTSIPNSTASRFGSGFRLSLSERIEALSQTADKELYEAGYRIRQLDRDGTVHYFKTTDKSWEYADEFDSDAVIKAGPAGADYAYELNYDDGSKRLYSADGYFAGLIDQNGNRYKVTLISGGKMNVTDGAGRTAVLRYDGSGYLQSMTDPAGRVTSYSYTGGKLTAIRYPDGKTTGYAYNGNGLLECITAADGTGVSFTYKAVTSKSKTFYRVASVTRSGTQSAYNTLSFRYDGDTTTVSDNNGTVNQIGFDVFGRAVSVLDQDANLVTDKYNNGGNIQNTVAESSNAFACSNNYLSNHSFENDQSGWNVYYALDGYSGQPSTTEKKAGNKSFQLVRSAFGGIYLNQDYSCVSPGETYTFSGYMKIDGTVNGDCGVKIEVKSGDTTLSTEYSITYATTESKWKRVQATVTIPSGADRIRMFAYMEVYDPGKVYFDCMQLEKEDAASTYNYLQNPNLDLLDSSGFASNWAPSSSGVAVTQTYGNNSWIKITGNPGSNRNVSQTVNVSGSKDAVLVFGGIAKGGCSAQCNNTSSNSRRFGLALYLYNGSTLVTSKSIWYNANAININQGISGSVKATGTFNKVVFRLIYNQEVNEAYFDDLYLYADDYGNSYTYDSDGRLTVQKSDSGDAIRYTYSGPDVTKISFEKNGKEKDTETYTYDSHHNVLTATTKDGIKTTYTYPSVNRGMPVRIQMQNADGSLKSQVDCTYTAYDNYLAEEVDENGERTVYDYDTVKGLLRSVTDPKGNVTTYTYDPNNDSRLSASGNINGSENAVVNYEYDGNGHVTAISPSGTRYGFTYDQFGRTVSTSVGGHPLSSVTFNANGTVATSSFGNGAVHSYSYDSMDRVTSESYDGSVYYKYAYNKQGEIGRMEDADNGVTWYYDYDLAGRLTEEDGSNKESNKYTYNDKNDTSSYSSSKNGTVISSAEYGYTDTGILQSVKTNNAHPNFSYSHDGLARLTEESHAVEGGSVKTQYKYRRSSSGETGEISEVTYSNGHAGIKYSYNADGTISSIEEAGKTTSYLYDGLGRLVRENDQAGGRTVVYTYDTNGNILSKTEYPYSTGDLGAPTRTVAYTYNTGWGDQLATYDGGETITYDTIGNPLSYRGYTLTWQKGRELHSMNGNGKSLTFKYDADGDRIAKINGDKTTSYTYASGLLMSQTDGQDTLAFTYDPEGKALAVKYNGTDYYYLYNIQGDVISLYDSTGATVVDYRYDSWGRPLSVTGSLANTLGAVNPIRYRGYYYDTETGLYLLKTRYYDPETCRFISSDGVLDNRDVSTLNLYSYCGNDPINNADEDGRLLGRVIVGAVIGGAVGGIYGWLKYGNNKKKIINYAVMGAVCGGIAAVLSPAIAKAAIKIAGSACYNALKNRTKRNFKKATKSTRSVSKKSFVKRNAEIAKKTIKSTFTEKSTVQERRSDVAAFHGGVVSGMVGVVTGKLEVAAFDKGDSDVLAKVGYFAFKKINSKAADEITRQSIILLLVGE